MPTKKSKKFRKGEVAIVTQKDRLRLRWRWQGERYVMVLGLPDSPLNRNVAKAKAAEIERDMAWETFDTTLERYRHSINGKANSQQTITPELFEKYIGQLPPKNTPRYNALLANLTRHGDIEDESDAHKFFQYLSTRQASVTLNSNRFVLVSFGKWLVENKYIPDNIFANLPTQKVQHDRTKRRPFTTEEVRQFLATMRVHPNYYCYYDFCLLLFTLGLRPSEAIGLRWQDVDLERGTVEIAESLSRNQTGSGRIRKETKTGTTRTLKLNTIILDILKGRKNSTSRAGDLIFLSPKGLAIDDVTFCQKVWRTICKQAGIEYRPPYVARHTCISHLIENGASLVQAAAVAGHVDTTMVAKTYGHMIEQPDLPSF
jgi:integrase